MDHTCSSKVQKYWLPYTISNAIVTAVLLLSWKRPKAGRISLGIIFLLASIVNAKTAIISPADYLFYRDMTLLDLYRDFIDGWFATHTQAMVLAIAAGQFVIAIGMFSNQRLWRRIAIVGILIFGIAISPLGVGAAFPFPLLLAFAAILLWKEPLNQQQNLRTSKEPIR